jgi:hypothetical protein
MTRGRAGTLRWAFVAWCLGCTGVAAQSPQIHAVCNRDQGQVTCDVRPGQVTQVGKITATVAGKEVSPLSYETFDAGGRNAAWYFLIQNPGNPKDSARDIDRITLAGTNSRRLFGVGIVGDRFEEVASLGASSGQIGQVKDKIKAGDRVDLYRAAADGLARLNASSASRKALVLMADGRSNYDAGRPELVKALNDNNILLYTVFMSPPGASQSDKAKLDSLRNETNGVGFNAVTCKTATPKVCDVELEASAVRDFFLYLEQGAVLKLASSAVP